MRRKLFVVVVGCALIVSSCVNRTEADKQRIQAEDAFHKINWVCSDIYDSLNNVIKKNNNFLKYRTALDKYEKSGNGAELEELDAPDNYYSAYQDAATKFSEIKTDLKGPTLILDSVLRDLLKIVQAPQATLRSVDRIITSKWNARTDKIRILSTLVEALCSSDDTIRKGVVYSVTSSCDLNCHFSQKSKVINVLVPDDTKGKKSEFGSWEYQTKAGSVSEVSKFYLSTLISKGWKLQPESKLDPTEDSEEGFLVSQIWCRTSPSYLNLLLIVNDLVEQPGVTYISLGTDKDKSLGCK